MVSTWRNLHELSLNAIVSACQISLWDERGGSSNHESQQTKRDCALPRFEVHSPAAFFAKISYLIQFASTLLQNF